MAAPQHAPSCPTPPPGYRAAASFEYPKIKLQIAAVLAVVGAPPLLLRLASLLQQQAALRSVRITRVADMIVVLATALAAMMAHELMHGVAYRVLGYRVTYGVSLYPFAMYVAAFRQWHKRDRSIVTALAPLVALTAICVPMLALPSRPLVLVGLTALTMNASAAVGDLYLVWRLLGLPRATLFYPVDMETMLVCVPVAQGEGGPPDIS